MKSLLFQGNPPFTEPPACAALPCRTEVGLSVRKEGRIYRYVLRDKIVPEDPYLVGVRAAGFARLTGEPNNWSFPPRSVRDFLIKNSVVI